MLKIILMFYVGTYDIVIRHEKSPQICGFLCFLFQLRMNFFVCIKLPNSFIYAIKFEGGGGDGSQSSCHKFHVWYKLYSYCVNSNNYWSLFNLL